MFRLLNPDQVIRSQGPGGRVGGEHSEIWVHPSLDPPWQGVEPSITRVCTLKNQVFLRVQILRGL